MEAGINGTQETTNLQLGTPENGVSDGQVISDVEFDNIFADVMAALEEAFGA